jgi:alpha-galactosidase
MAKVRGLDATISAYTERRPALDGADYVVCSAAQQLFMRFATDRAIAHKHDPKHIVSEFGGVAGITYSLRQIALMESIVQDIRAYCADALLLDAANPLPRVCQAAHELGARTVGFCALSEATYGVLWRMATGAQLEFPYAAARQKWSITMAGVNHFCWITDIQDRSTGQSVRAALLEQARAGGLPDAPVATRLLRDLDCLLIPVDGHTADFLTPTGATRELEEPGHGSPDQRRQRMELLAAIGAGTAAWEPLFKKPSWERPGDLIAAL